MSLCTITQAEKDILALLGEVWNRYLELPEKGDWDRVEFMFGVHRLQNHIAARHVWEDESDVKT